MACKPKSMKPLFCFVIILFPSLLFAQPNNQKIKANLSKIKTLIEAKEFLYKNTSVNGELLHLNSRIDTSSIYNDFWSKKVGENAVIETSDSTYFSKIFEIKVLKSYRVQYIFLDNKTLSLNQIDSLRNIIRGKITEGVSFDELAAQYSMDGNSKKGGDLGWFDEGMMNKTFEDGVKSHKTGEVYNVDVKDEKWCYVVKNSYEPATYKKMTVVIFSFAK